MPKIVGEYKIIKTLGKGIFSNVKKVMNVKTEKEYAMKIIQFSDINSSEKEPEIRHRIKIMSKLHHPGLVNLLKILHNKNNLFLIFDLCEDEFFNTLAHLCPLPEETARKYFQQLIDVLTYMHDNGAVFRDLKLENLLIDSAGNLRIADFIFSNIINKSLLPSDDFDSSESSSTIDEDEDDQKSDKPQIKAYPLRFYVAPEVLHEEGYVPEAADIWSAGIILYVMLTGELPFNAETADELEKKVNDPHFSFPSTVPTKVSRMLKWMLKPDPRQRLTIKEIKQNEWFKTNYVPVLGDDMRKQNEIPDVEVEIHLSADTKKKKIDSVNESCGVFELIAKLSGVNIDSISKNRDVNNSEKNLTTFTSPKSIQDAIESVHKNLKALAAYVKKSKHHTVIKAIIPICSKHVYIRITLTKIQSDLTLVDIDRLEGGQLDFLRIFKIFRADLTGSD